MDKRLEFKTRVQFIDFGDGKPIEAEAIPEEPAVPAEASVDLEEGEEAAEAEQVDAIDEAVARLEAEGYTPEEIDDSIRRVEAKAEEGLRQEAAAAARAWLREGLDDEDDDGDGDDGIE
jgi:hypothetical protein